MTRHDLDLFSLLSGLVLTGIALAALFGVSIDVGVWVGPTILIAVGVIVLASVLTSASRRTAEAAAPGAGPDTDDPGGHDPDRAEALATAREEVEAADHGSD